MNFLQDLFSADGFPARWVCGLWTPFHGWLYILSNLAIWLAYFVIPVLLFIFIRGKKEGLPFSRTFWLFILFTFACGLTHLADSIMFWYPAYRLSASLLFCTAVVSWVTAIHLFRMLPRLLALKTPSQVEAIIQQKFEKLTEDLRISEERWQFALEGSQLGVWDWNAQTNEVFFSKRWKEILGFQEHEITNEFQEWYARVHPEDRAWVMALTVQQDPDGDDPSSLEYRIRCKDGAYKWVRASGKIMARDESGQRLRVVGTLEDIHETKLIQEKLRLSENTFSSGFEFSGNGMAFIEPGGKMINVNPAVCKLLGYEKEELLQKTYQEITHTEDLDVCLALTGKLLKKEINTFQIEKRYLHKNGQPVWVLLTVSMVWGTDYKPRFFYIQFIDITQTKELLKELEQNNKTLQLTALDLEGKVRQLEEFNNIVAHNLRGPAGNIKMLLGLLPSGLPAIRDVVYYDMLCQSSENLKRNLDDLMKVVEVRLNRDIKFDSCNVEEILNNTLISLKQQVLEKEAVIEQSLEAQVIPYPKAYLESIVYNLVSNAIKYAQPQVSPHIRIRTYSENGRYVLSVKDNGLGIDLQKYGDQVFKLKKVFHAGYDSKGVGLFMTKNQIETFGGNIKIISAPLQGSEFIVNF